MMQYGVARSQWVNPQLAESFWSNIGMCLCYVPLFYIETVQVVQSFLMEDKYVPTFLTR